MRHLAAISPGRAGTVIGESLGALTGVHANWRGSCVNLPLPICPSSVPCQAIGSWMEVPMEEGRELLLPSGSDVGEVFFQYVFETCSRTFD